VKPIARKPHKQEWSRVTDSTAVAQDSDRLRNEQEAAWWLGLSVGTMRRRRLLREPPAWVKLGGRVLYRESDLRAFVEANVVSVTGGRE
jgi:hypothetical protein